MIGYLDTPSGISGDMFLGCLVDAGWPIDELRDTLNRLHLPADSWHVEARDVMKGALRAKLVDVRVLEGAPAMGLLQVPAHSHSHRNLNDIRAIINAADLPAAVKERSIAVFSRLASAEAKVHGTTIEQVHFHEVGALDAIVDIVGTVAGVHALCIETLYAGPLPLGEGWTKSAHGMIPLPAPATLELLSAAGANAPAPGPGELVTPTGAALVVELATFERPPMRISRVGLGAGQKDFAWPNIARLWLGTLLEATAPRGDDNSGEAVVVETNIDDMNPQLYAPVLERLFAAGARDVWLTPIQMKKNRPAITLSVLALPEHEQAMIDLILRETTTLGVRVSRVNKTAARREWRTVKTPFGEVRLKLKYVKDELLGAMPEYEDCRKAAEAAGVAVREVWEAAMGMAIERTSGK